MASAQAANLKKIAQTLLFQAEQLESAGSSGKPTAPILSDVANLADDLRLEVVGNFQYLLSLGRGYHEVATCAVISKFELQKHVPDEGTISFEELSKKSGCPLDQMTRILRHAVLVRLFVEPTPGQLGHSTLTKIWKNDEVTTATMGVLTLEFFPGAAVLAEALYKYGDGQEPNQSGVVLANNTTSSFFEILTAHPPRLDQFNVAMRMATSVEKSESRTKVYDWSSLNTLIDVGGGQGHIAVDIVKAHPKVKAVVLDFEETVAAGRKNLPAELTDKVTFKAHDFFKDTPPKDADAYFLSHVLHDWPDKYCVKILKTIVPAMKPGSKILLGEVLMPKPGQKIDNEKSMRFHDFQMMIICNSKERTIDEFKALLEEADPRLQFKKAYTDIHCPQAGAVIEVEFTG